MTDFDAGVTVREHSLEWIAGEIDRRVSRELYARVRRGESALQEASSVLLAAGAECETEAWRFGTRPRNARALLRHVDPALDALRAAGAADLVEILAELREEIVRRAEGP